MAGKAQKAGKSKRPQSEHKKMSRAKCRNLAAQRHDQAGRQQELRHQHNLRLAKDGELTPWQQAQVQRAARRLITCAEHRVVFTEDEKTEQLCCPVCHRTVNLKAAWEKRGS